MEAELQSTAIALLRQHPKVAWIERMNTGAIHRHGRLIHFAFAGCSDIIGQTVSGHFLACEIKGESDLSADQEKFLECVQQHHGIAIEARDVYDIDRALAKVIWTPTT